MYEIITINKATGDRKNEVNKVFLTYADALSALEFIRLFTDTDREQLEIVETN